MQFKSFFDLDHRLEDIDRMGDPLVALDQVIAWEKFRPLLNRLRNKKRKSNAGHRPFDIVLMLKILILQSLYNLSDNRTEFMIRDRLSFARFLRIDLGDRVPKQRNSRTENAKTFIRRRIRCELWKRICEKVSDRPIRKFKTIKMVKLIRFSKRIQVQNKIETQKNQQIKTPWSKKGLPEVA